MSEYSNFLKHFNKLKSSGKNDSRRDDIIPLSNRVKEIPDEEETELNEAETAEEKKAEENIFKEEDSHKDEIPAQRFIKTNDTPFISVKHMGEDISPTTVEKYTDRLVARTPEKKLHTGYTGKINTYAANHSASTDSVKFIPVSDEEKQEAQKNSDMKETPEKTAESQTKIMPEKLDTSEAPPGAPKVIVEKLEPEDSPEIRARKEKTKQLNAKGELLREIAKTSAAEMGEDAEQLTLEGSEEEILEKELIGVRQKRIKNFRFWSESARQTGENEDPSYNLNSDERQMAGIMAKFEKRFRHLDSSFVPLGNDEYTDPSKRRAVFKSLMGIRKNTLLKAGILGVTGLILFIINIAASMSAAMHNGFFEIFGSSTVIYNTVNLVFLIFAGIIMADDIKKGIFSVLKMRPKTDSVLTFMFTCALIQNIASFFTLLKPESDYHLLTGAVLLMCVPVLLSKVFFYDSVRQCFKAVSATSDKAVLRRVADEGLAASLIKENVTDETNIVYTGKTRFINSFLKRSSASAFAAQTSSRAVAASVVISFAAGIIAWAVSKSFLLGLSYLTLSACLSLPVSCLLFGGFMLSKENTSLSVKSSFIGSYSDARDFCSIDDLILNDADLFTAEIISAASEKGVSTKQAEYCASAIANKTEGILNKAFREISSEYEDLYPEIENLVYEDKLGFSAWISDCRVLLGSADFMKDHSVDLPDEESLPIAAEENCKPLFLAIEGHFAAVFSIKYSYRKEAAKNLRDLAKGGTNILLATSDPNITESFSEKLLGLPADSLRIMNRSVHDTFETQRNTVTDSEEAGIVFPDSFDSFSRIAGSALKLDALKRFSKILCEACIAVSLLLALGLSVTGSVTGVSVWVPVLLQILWIVLCFTLTPMLISSSAIKDTMIKKPVKKTEKKEKPEIIQDEDRPEEEEEKAEEKPEEKPVKHIKHKKEERAEESVQVNPDDDDDFPTLIKPAFRKKKKGREIPEAEPEIKETEDEPAQLKMEMPEAEPFAVTPQVIDFDAIQAKEAEEEMPELTVTEEMLDFFADTDAKQRRRNRIKQEKKDEEAGIPPKKHFLLDDDDIFDTAPTKKKKKAEPFFTAESTPPPPRYNLGAPEEPVYDDPLDASFVPPESEGPTELYDDSFFSRFDPKEEKKEKRYDEFFEDFEDFDI